MKELAHLQGVPETIYQRMLKKLLTEHASDKKWTETRCENEVAAAFGDGMSVNVLQRVSLSLNPVAVCWEPAVKLSLPWPILSPESFLEHLDLKSVSGSAGENNVLLGQLLQPQ